MKITLVLTDSFSDCTKAIKEMISLGEKLSANMEVLAVLEDLYKLEKASISLGVPLPPDTVPSAKERFEDRIKTVFRHSGLENKIKVQVVAGELKKEVENHLKDSGADLLMFGCPSAHHVCKVIDELGVSSLIIK